MTNDDSPLVFDYDDLEARTSELYGRLSNDAEYRTNFLANPTAVVARDVLGGTTVPVRAVETSDRLLVALLQDDDFVSWVDEAAAQVSETGATQPIDHRQFVARMRSSVENNDPELAQLVDFDSLEGVPLARPIFPANDLGGPVPGVATHVSVVTEIGGLALVEIPVELFVVAIVAGAVPPHPNATRTTVRAFTDELLSARDTGEPSV